MNLKWPKNYKISNFCAGISQKFQIFFEVQFWVKIWIFGTKIQIFDTFYGNIIKNIFQFWCKNSNMSPTLKVNFCQNWVLAGHKMDSKSVILAYCEIRASNCQFKVWTQFGLRSCSTRFYDTQFSSFFPFPQFKKQCTLKHKRFMTSLGDWDFGFVDEIFAFFWKVCLVVIKDH